MGRPPTHGLSNHELYPVWRQMLRRCFEPKDKSYYLYGAKGIRVCRRWQSFKNFLADMAPRPAGMSIDRINNKKGYSPSNCRWATNLEQGRNKTDNRLITFQGETLCLKDWSKRFGVHWATIHTRLKMGWTLKDALTIPAMNMSKPRLWVNVGGVPRLIQEGSRALV